ncbi:hypothetical protein BDV93DRAFT_407317, partial [Ceratobasidium sp. AG-I]
LFKTLDRGTVGAWIKPDNSGWTQQALDRAVRAAASITAQEAPRSHFPEVVDGIVLHITNIRRSGALVTRTIAHSVVLAFISTGAPILYNDPRFKCSQSYTRHLLKKFLDYAYRAGTQAAQHLP